MLYNGLWLCEWTSKLSTWFIIIMLKLNSKLNRSTWKMNISEGDGQFELEIVVEKKNIHPM